ncbi:CC-factor-like-like [Octopus vulgaris]|uniref:CC-factor-like-like n=2 Tax=Octopus TaxID=6643 RepID=A0AA36AK61_OCTVU|nr:C-factor-like [Octopus sinensis]CAI9716147.1 CC-factor-like-like [Octopus vulgaris]
MVLNVKSVLITGSSRGIGLEFVKQLLRLPTPPRYVFATCRNPEKAEDLQSLKKDNSNLRIVPLDICNEASIIKAKEAVENEVEDNGLNLLINNAGLKLSVTFEKLNFDSMMEAFKTNAVAPSVLTRIFFPLLKAAAAKENPSTNLSCNRAAVVNISSILGSVTATREKAFFYEYSSSKAALNMITKDFGIHLKPHNVLAVALHPGWVQTDMGGKTAALTPESSVKQSLNTLSTLNESNAGFLIDYQGSVIP